MRRQVDGGGRQGVRQRGDVLHRLGRPAAERAESVRARPVLHLECRRRPQPRPRVRRHRAPATRRRRVRRVRIHERALRGRHACANGVDVTDNEIPYTPDYTATFGGQLTHAITSAINGLRACGDRAVRRLRVRRGQHRGQDAYSLVNLRAGARHKRLFGEVWLRNAFDTRYVPIAIPYPGFAPSGFIGENGRPRTFGDERRDDVLGTRRSRRTRRTRRKTVE